MRAVIITALIALLLPAAAGSSGAATGLRGHVTVGGHSAVHRQLWFRKFIVVTKVTTDAAGNYRILLGPGAYTVSTVGNVGVRPTSVTVVSGRLKVVNFVLPH
jgi:hypothetical protein